MNAPSEPDACVAVLHLEDSPQDAELVRERLAGEGVQVRVDWAASEREFEDCLRRGRYDVILADYQLPGFDAPAALRLAATLCPATPFICVSGAIGEDLAVELLRQGATDYVRKDRLDRLSLAVRRAVEEAREHRARQEAEAALRFRTLILATQQEASLDGILVVGDSGQVISSNRRFVEMWGLPSEALESRSDARLLQAVVQQLAMPEEFLNRVQWLYAHPQETSRDEIKLIDGRVLDRYSAPMIGSDGKYYGRVWSFRDITERKRAEEALRVQSAALNAAANAIVITDPKGGIEWVNPAFETLTGFSAAEALGRNPRALVKSDQHERAFYTGLWGTILAGEVWSGDIINRRKDGSLYTEEMTITPVRDESGGIAHFVAIKADVTDRRRLEDELRQAQKMDAIGRLAGGVAHDFNNALAIILGFAELALGRLDPLDPLHRHISEIVRTTGKAADLTRRLLAFARREIILPRVLELNSAIASVEKMLSRLIGEDIDLRIVPGEGLWNVKIDPSQVDQILVNLATNARDAIPDTGTITVETANAALGAEYCRRRAGVEPGEYVLLAVTDSGAGMDKATLERVFEPFFTTKAEGKGTGLGLATVYGIVKQNGGFVDVYSEPGHGTTFKVYLPRCAGAAEQPVKQAQRGPLTGTETVLIVEDEPQLLEIAQESLQSLGYMVLTAGSPGDAILLCESYSGEIHVLLTDVVMPTMNGRDLRARLERIKPGLRTVFMSGYTANIVAHRGILADGVVFVQKPFTLDTLAAKIRVALSRV